MTNLNLHGQFILAQRSARKLEASRRAAASEGLSPGAGRAPAGNNERLSAERPVRVARLRFDEISEQRPEWGAFHSSLLHFARTGDGAGRRSPGLRGGGRPPGGSSATRQRRGRRAGPRPRGTRRGGAGAGAAVPALRVRRDGRVEQGRGCPGWRTTPRFPSHRLLTGEEPFVAHDLCFQGGIAGSGEIKVFKKFNGWRFSKLLNG